MSVLRPSRGSLAAEGLSPPEQAQARPVAARLRGEIIGTLARVRRSGPSALSLARDLRIDRNLTQRVLHALEAGDEALEFLARLPGPEGLRAFARAALRRTEAVRTATSDDSAPILRAIEQYERLVWTVGGSHTRFAARCRAARNAVGRTAERDGAARGTLTEAATAILGYGVALVTHISVVRPIPGQPELLEGCSAFGLIGLTSQRARVCVASTNMQLRNTAGAVAGEVRWTPLGRAINGRDGLLTEFCSAPNVLSTSDEGDGYIRQLVDLELLRARGAVDVVLARRWSPDTNPQHTPDPVWSHILRMRHPSRHMLFDAYMHESMLGSSAPEIGAYVWHPSLKDDPRSQWDDRLPIACALQTLPAAPAPAEAAVWARQAELTDRLFALVGWDRREFVGHRCDDDAPVWSAAYYMTFDLRGEPPPLLASP